MEKVPQIVRHRLKAGSPAIEHPDADVLTAFSERSLSQVERAGVIDHLSRCGECRDVVALALPYSEPMQEAPRVSAAGWLTWPVLRWGFAAAGIIAIASFGVMQYQRQRGGHSTVAYTAPRPEALEKEAKNAPPQGPTSQSQDGDKMQSVAASSGDRKSHVVTGAGPVAENSEASALGGPAGAIGGIVRRVSPSGGPKVQWQQNANNFQQQAPVQAAPQSPAMQMETVNGVASSAAPVRVQTEAQTVEVQAQSGAIENKPATLDAPVLESQRIDQEPMDSGHAELKVERIKPAETGLATAPKSLAADSASPTAPAGAPLNGRHFTQLSTISPGWATRWTINSAGGLQRSIDGSTWQDVDVNSSAASSGADLAVVSKTSRAKDASEDKLKKKDISPLVFRSVAANGTEVWAGAADGVLYHSADAGTHWTRVVPSNSGATLTGDIVSLEFLDSQHGRIVTSTPEVWTTSDAGQSWQKQ